MRLLRQTGKEAGVLGQSILKNETRANQAEEPPGSLQVAVCGTACR